MANKRERQSAILETVNSRLVSSQEDLRKLLLHRGWDVTQATLSRDLRELGLAKTPRGYLVPQAPQAQITQFAPAATREAKLQRALRGSALSVQAAGSLVIVRTPPAAAHPVARALDEAELAGLVGTIAGDDTVFVATPSDGAARTLARRLVASLERRA